MELSKLIANCNVISIKGDEKTEVSAIASDSRQVQHGSLLWLLKVFVPTVIPI